MKAGWRGEEEGQEREGKGVTKRSEEREKRNEINVHVASPLKNEITIWYKIIDQKKYNMYHSMQYLAVVLLVRLCS